MRLAERYAERPAEEFPLVFQRIVQNAIRDHFRRQKVRAGVLSPMSVLAGRSDDEDDDPLDRLPVEVFSFELASPEHKLSRDETLGLIEKALADLPARQREAFLLRYWEEFDVAETHCSRATHALAAALKTKGYLR